MTGPTVTRRALVQGSAAALGAVALPGVVVQPLAVLVPTPAEPAPAFDAAGFVADLRAAGCEVVSILPGTNFGPGDEAPTYFIRPGPGYSRVMARWTDAMDACPDHISRVLDFLEAERAAAVAGSQT